MISTLKCPLQFLRSFKRDDIYIFYILLSDKYITGYYLKVDLLNTGFWVLFKLSLEDYYQGYQQGTM